jgi:uncharacterized protein
MNRYTAIVMIMGLATVIRASDLPDYPFVSVGGDASIEIAPEQARISVTVKAFDKDPTNALATVEGRSRELLTFASSHKIKDEDVKAYEIDKAAVRREQKDSQDLDIIGYEVTRRFEILLKDLAGYEVIIRKLLSMENVTSCSTSFERKDAKKICLELREKASRDAKEQAEQLAKAFGVDLGTVQAISERGFHDLPAVFLPLRRERVGVQVYTLGGDSPFGDASTERGNDNTLFVPSTITFEAHIDAIYRLKEKKE